MKTGLTSVSFRKYTVDQVIDLAKEAGVFGIEWGSDVHVPKDDLTFAKEVREKTLAAGLSVISYGSYFTLGTGEDFLPYIKCAKALGTETIRIWGGKKEQSEMGEEEYALLVSQMKEIGKMAEKEGVTVCLEYHGHSVTATALDAAKFASDVGLSSVRLYWQEIIGRSMVDNLSDIDIVAPYLKNVHVFNYIDGKQELLSRGDGPDRWRAYANRIAKIGCQPAFMTEFCKGGAAESFLEDAKVLKDILKDF